MVELKGLYFSLQRPPRVPRSSYTVPSSTGFEINGSSSELAIEMAIATGYLDFSTLYQIHDLGNLIYFHSLLEIMAGRNIENFFLSREVTESFFCFFFSSSYVY